MADLRNVRLALAPRRDTERGPIGFIRARYGNLEHDGIALRWIRRGEPAIAWPCRRDRSRGHAVVRPRSLDVRRDPDRQILNGLGLGEGGAP